MSMLLCSREPRGDQLRQSATPHLSQSLSREYIIRSKSLFLKIGKYRNENNGDARSRARGVLGAHACRMCPRVSRHSRAGSAVRVIQGGCGAPSLKRALAPLRGACRPENFGVLSSSDRDFPRNSTLHFGLPRRPPDTRGRADPDGKRRSRRHRRRRCRRRWRRWRRASTCENRTSYSRSCPTPLPASAAWRT
jgi:hypothetical protein